MSSPATSKCACQSCGVHLEYAVEAEGACIACPQCGEQTQLLSPSVEQSPSAAPALSYESLQAAFVRPVARPRVSLLYQLGLLIVALTMLMLPLLYLAMIGAAGWAAYYWATHFSFLLSEGGGGRLMIGKIICYIAPLLAGVVLIFFMIKPLFARRAPHAQPLALNPGAEPLLFAFVTKVCQAIGAPFPTRIDIDCQLNAAAGFRRGVFSFLGNDLVLIIGLPLVAGLNLRDFAGVLAHEFGHFTQGFGMRLTYVIRTVNAWFARVVYERDSWDLMLEEAAETPDTGQAILVGLARLGVWFSRKLLALLMLIGHGIGCFMLRQMEYDADSYQMKLVGSAAFESTKRRVHVLGATLDNAYKAMRVSWNLNKHLPDDFPRYFMEHARQLPDAARTHLEDTMGLEATGLFDTHPSDGDRIRRARQAGESGVFDFDASASALFSNFEVPCKQVTLLHYEDDLGIPVGLAKLMPVQTKAADTAAVETSQAEEPTVAADAPMPGGLRIRRRITGQG